MDNTNYLGLLALFVTYVAYVINYHKLVIYINGLVRNPKVRNNDNTLVWYRDPLVWYDLSDGNARYKGEWVNGIPHGKGVLEFITDCHSIIEGEFVDGYAVYGRQIFDREYEKMVPYYVGEFKNNLQHGNGEYYYGNGSYYKGEFKEGKFHGQGIEYCHIKNLTFVGEFYNDGHLKGTWKQM